MSRPADPLSPLSETDPVLEQLIEECAGHLEAGEALDVEAYVRRHPEYEERLRRILPAMQALAVHVQVCVLSVLLVAPYLAWRVLFRDTIGARLPGRLLVGAGIGAVPSPDSSRTMVRWRETSPLARTRSSCRCCATAAGRPCLG